MAELTWRAVDLRRANGTVWSWLERGWIDEPASVRGEDVTIPGKAGRTRMNRVKDRRIIVLRTVLKASTPAAFKALIVEMQALWDPTLAPGALVLADQYRGLAGGQTATIQVAFVNVIPAMGQLETRREYSVEAECIADPPDWVLS